MVAIEQHPATSALTHVVPLLLFALGLLCLITQRNAIKQIIGLKIILQGVALELVHAGRASGDLRLAETMVASALIVETVVIAIAVALIVNVFHRDPTGDVDRLNRLRG
jgi:NADH:ubiquinone oxidoreductase subunit K